MARKRMIDPEFWSDEKIGNLSIQARALFIGMWNFADDEGVLKARAEFLKSNILPYDDVTVIEVEKWINEIIEQNLIFSYINAGQKYAVIINFKKHQVINKPTPSKLPKPSIQNKDYQRAIFERDNWTCHLCGDYLKDRLVSRNGIDGMPSIDHLIPQSEGGLHMPDNLATACLKCNKGRGNKDIQEYYDNTTVVVTPEEKRREVKLSKVKLREDKIEPLSLSEEEILVLSEKYQVPIAFVLSKQDDVNNWVMEKPAKARGRNLKATLANWVKRDAIERRENAKAGSKIAYVGDTL